MCVRLQLPLSHPAQSGLTISRNTSDFPEDFGNFLNEKKFNYTAFVTSLIIILKTVKCPFKVQERPTDFNARDTEIFTDVISDSML